ncbi:P-loop ATPase, Sll1717 family [Lacrimispora sp.]|uniref:P-loop ATPase, Sll1717 family n=1 Tax=Lacrimispora sp. TaxID=2719234 RepID=UPI00289D79B6|nr:hypothetical protein [Lacrimispora sp.]
MNKLKILENINLGNEVAEYDDNIGHYYINTNYVDDFVDDKYDIVKGVKGSGKTAMLVALCQNQINYSQLNNKILLKAMQLKGDPDFRRAFDTVSIESTDTQKIIDAWKIYIINIMWRQVKDSFSGYESLEKVLKDENIITEKNGILHKLLHAIDRVKLKASNTFNTDGSTIQTLEISSKDSAITEVTSNIDLIDFNDIFNEFDRILQENDSCIWVMLDRLDDAFPDNSDKDNIILKSLFYAYKDICSYKGFKLKIFIREDIFDEITKNRGFTSLTHISAKTMYSLKWDREIVEKLLIERLLFNKTYSDYMNELHINTNLETLSSEDRINIIFRFIKPQIDIGKKNPDSIGWIINHVTDGNGIYTPRDIIKLFDTARGIQLKKLKENNFTDISENYLINQLAIKESYKTISKDKLIVQLYAEYPTCRPWIEKFKNHKAEHSEESLKKILGSHWKSRVEKLKRIGFIEEKSNSWKIPFLYREGLNITRGKSQ